MYFGIHSIRCEILVSILDLDYIALFSEVMKETISRVVNGVPLGSLLTSEVWKKDQEGFESAISRSVLVRKDQCIVTA